MFISLLFISTDLKDQTVNNPFFKFNLQAKMGENDADVKVLLNGKNITGKDGKYSVILKKGKNTIVAKAEYDKYSITKKYEITLEYEDGFGIETDLENKTVNVENIEFQAVIRNGTDKAKLSVIVNGNIIAGNEGTYNAGLKIGNNTIRLKATDSGNVSLNETYTVKYVPLATKDTEPVISYINVTDGMEIKGESFTLYIGAMDYKKNKIYYDGIEVKLNGKKIQYRWSANYVGYLLNLQNGDNSLEVKITDSDGRYKEYSYKLKCTYIDEGTVIGTATVSIDAKVIHLGVLLRPKTVDIYYGDNAADIFERAIEKSGFSYTNSGTVDKGFYLETISRPGILRGWMIDDKLKDSVCIFMEKQTIDVECKYVSYLEEKVVLDSKVLVPQYHDKEIRQEIENVFSDNTNFELISLGELIEQKKIKCFKGHGSPSSDQRVGDIPYIKVSDIRAGQININPTNKIPLELAKKFWKGDESGLKAYDLISPERASKEYRRIFSFNAKSRENCSNKGSNSFEKSCARNGV